MDRAFYADVDDVKYLFLGHSRVRAGIELDSIQGSQGFCAGGESSVQTYYKLKYILESSDLIEIFNKCSLFIFFSYGLNSSGKVYMGNCRKRRFLSG